MARWNYGAAIRLLGIFASAASGRPGGLAFVGRYSRSQRASAPSMAVLAPTRPVLSPLIARRRTCSAALSMRGPRNTSRKDIVRKVLPPMNDEISAPELRVVVVDLSGQSEDESLGVISRAEAIAKADEIGVDLVLTAPDARPPVAKVSGCP